MHPSVMAHVLSQVPLRDGGWSLGPTRAAPRRPGGYEPRPTEQPALRKQLNISRLPHGIVTRGSLTWVPGARRSRCGA